MTHRGRPLPFLLRERIKTLRTFNRLTVRETARLVGVNKETVVTYSRGLRGERHEA
jgi:transcriptional regulator with XRE-family HTH domain